MTPGLKADGWTAAKVVLLISCSLLAACGFLDRVPGSPPERVLPSEEARARGALAGIEALAEADVHLRLANHRLASLMQRALGHMAERDGALPLRDFRVEFGHQSITFTSTLEPSGPDGSQVHARLSGEIQLVFSGGSLLWTPRFAKAALPVNATAGGKTATRDAMDELVNRANATIAGPMVAEAANAIRVDYFPVLRIETGVTVDQPGPGRFTGRQWLEGFFVNAGQSVLIEPGFTSALLDLELMENFSRCSPGLQASRSVFTGAIRQREPQGLPESGVDGRDMHFFTEIRGATQVTEVVHYWFADGRPAGFEELRIEPSARWRTWSTRPSGNAEPRVWEVVVVERETGCVLVSRALAAETGRVRDRPEQGSPGAYGALRSAFDQRLGGMGGRTLRPDWMVTETRREFLSDTMVSQLSRAEVAVVMGLSAPGEALQASLLPPRIGDQACERRQCRTQQSCQTAVSRCVRQYDSRDCRVCQFRNPLNNRCVSEVTDPVCEAARAARNRRFESERQVCLVEEEHARVECERSRAQEIQSCELEAKLAENICAANLEALRKLNGSGSLAQIEGQAQSSGSTTARFRAFQLAPDFSSLTLEFMFSPDTVYHGRWRLKPTDLAGGLAECLERWGGAFRTRLIMPAPRLTLIGHPVQQGREWITTWSGFVLPVMASPTPMESVFRAQPGQLAGCGIALTPSGVQEAVRGRDAGFLRGQAELTIRPLPTRLILGPDDVHFDLEVLRGNVTWQGDHLAVEAVAEES